LTGCFEEDPDIQQMEFTNYRSSAVTVSFTVTAVDTDTDVLSKEFELAASSRGASNRQTYDSIEYKTDYEISAVVSGDSEQLSSSHSFTLPSSSYGLLISIEDNQIDFGEVAA